jgi:hypothetical protein
MKSLFPYTPTMEYERMLAATTVAFLAFLFATQSGFMLVQIVGTVPALGSAAFLHEMLRVVAFAGASCGFTLLGLACVLFASTKAQFRRRTQYMHVLRCIRSTGLRLVRIALGCAVLWLVASAVLAASSGI